MGLIDKLHNFKDCYESSKIYDAYYNQCIDQKRVYLESRNGNDFTGNIFRIAEELSKGEYGHYKIYVFANEEVKAKIIEFQKNYNLNIRKIITDEYEACKILERAKYIVTDSGIRPKFIKKKGQIMVNTWHGTPLKLMGFENPPEQPNIGIIQRSLLNSDYLIYPNDYMKEVMLNAYMIEKIYPGEILLEGYPRNTVFLNPDLKDEFKKRLSLEDKEIFVYMPTFKGTVSDRKDEEQKDDVTGFLKEIDMKLKENQILFVKFHPYNQSKIDFSAFSHIREFPKGYETYDILNMADVLVTDYSSVFFDFANTARKIILFNYDEEDYMSYRGTYIPLDELPFPKVQTVDDLISQLNSPKEYDDEQFKREFCKYERVDACQRLCRKIFNEQDTCNVERIDNDNPNILIFGGSLMKNGITSSLMNLLENVDRKNYNYFITFKSWDKYIKENHEDIFENMVEDVEFLPISYNYMPTVSEKMDLNKFVTATADLECSDDLKRLFKRTFENQFKALDFEAVIDFDGYNNDVSTIFANCGLNNSIFVHNDMLQEIEMRNKHSINILKYIYNQFGHVCVVSPDLVKSTGKIKGNDENIKIVHNIYNYRTIQDRAAEDLKLDETTSVYPDEDSLYDILNSDCKKFITIGRFSPEKGHERLLKAFDEFADEHSEVKLIIIGGHGDLYEHTLDIVNDMRHRQNVCIVKSISNPMPILAKCDLFIVSSFYEGWPIVIMEADSLDIPIVATDIVGTQWMKEYGGHIVEDSQQGILKGLNDFMNEKIDLLTIDAEEYNADAVNEFYSLFKR
ncbi:hypothetical protein TL18_04780 [Methanobrevibacter sp. YE315]|uniref:CDP-glycerol glycerophosphotransferase family protein n=1 Tax=Methanobrevibacter sp. YE315 TaxID=1609968 RepID=UPI000764E7D2|nr:CDP-glycerol glycerophosphotransferase family protein [Methanobrevibacter sp. YE315]AMD17393.1 hypothetical protein TL18_04780 [Methanobrevibacter sp. YE315]